MATTSKMTWNRLKNDSSISKSELPKIARAFGITVPKGWDTKKGTSTKSSVKKQTRTASSTQVGPTKKKAAAKKTYKKMETPKDAGPERTYKKKSTTKAKSTTKSTSRVRHGRSSSEIGGGSGRTVVSGRRKAEALDAGPEQAYVKRTKMGGTLGQRRRGTGPIVADRKVIRGRPTAPSPKALKRGPSRGGR